MKKMMYKYGFILVSSSFLLAQNVDKEYNEIKTKYNSKQFEYIVDTQQKNPNKEAAEKDWEWLKNLIKHLLNLEWKYIFFTIIGIVFLIIIYKMYRNGFFFQLTNEHKIHQSEENFDFIEKNLMTVDLDDLIEKAKAQDDFRLAIRYYHYQNSQNLAKKGYIKWDPKKTNQQILNEIKSISIKELFQNNTAIFNQVWFGQHILNVENFRTFEANFKFLNQSL